MNAEAQKLMDTINRLMAKGMSRDDDTIKTLEGLIEEELSKGETDDAFLQQPNRPQVERPGMKQFAQPKGTTPEDTYEQADMMRQADPQMPVEEIMRRLGEQVNQNPTQMPMDRGGDLTPEEFERQNPNWRDIERQEDQQSIDLTDVMRMMDDWKRGPEADKYELSENMGGIFDPHNRPSMSTMRSVELPAQYGFENIKRGLDAEFYPEHQISRERKTFARPGTQEAIHERNMRSLPPPLPRTAQDGFTLGNMVRPSFQRPSAGPMTAEEELEMIMKDAEDELPVEEELE